MYFLKVFANLNELCSFHARFYLLSILKLLSLLIDVPYPVMRLDFKIGCSSINLTWNPPSLDAEGGMVTGYRAQIKAASSEEPWTTKNVSQSTQSCLFTHLKPNSKYHVRVMAQNKMGNGWPSEVSTIPQAGDLRRKFVKCNPIRPTESRSYDCLSKFELISWVVRLFRPSQLQTKLS